MKKISLLITAYIIAITNNASSILPKTLLTRAATYKKINLKHFHLSSTLTDINWHDKQAIIEFYEQSTMGKDIPFEDQNKLLQQRKYHTTLLSQILIANSIQNNKKLSSQKDHNE